MSQWFNGLLVYYYLEQLSQSVKIVSQFVSWIYDKYLNDGHRSDNLFLIRRSNELFTDLSDDQVMYINIFFSFWKEVKEVSNNPI